MAVSLLEIIDRGEGVFILKRAETEAEPLVTIRFSAEARGYLADNGLDIARAMIQAGFHAAAVNTEQVEVEPSGLTPPVLH